MKNRPAFVIGVRLLVLAAIFVAGCGGGNGDSAPEGGPSLGTPSGPAKEVLIPPSGTPWSVSARADKVERFLIDYQLPPKAMRITSAAVDVPKTLAALTVTPGFTPKALMRRAFLLTAATPEGQVKALFRVGTDRETVCGHGKIYGPYTVSLGAVAQLAPDSPATASADEPTLQILNTGALVVCMDVLSTIDVTFDVNSVQRDVTYGDCGTPTNFAGRWTGTYTCGNSCNNTPFGGTVDLIVTQDGTVASYIDGGGTGDTYSGTVCGATFRFERSEPQETERGVMKLDSSNTATKRSTWQTTSLNPCGGDCVDHLTRAAN